MKILLFEDKHETNTLLTAQLEEQEYEVFSAMALSSAVDWITKGNVPELALLDIVDNRSRPTDPNKINSGGDEAGFFIASMLKEIDKTIPVIFFSAYGKEGHIQEGAEKFDPVEFFDKGGDETLDLDQSVMEVILKKIDLVMEKRKLLRKWEEYWGKVPFGKLSIIKKKEVEKRFEVSEKEIRMLREVNRNLFKKIEDIVYVENWTSYNSNFIKIELESSRDRISNHSIFDLFSNIENKPQNVDFIIIIELNGKYYEIKKGVEKLIKASINHIKNDIYIDKYKLTTPSQKEFKELILRTNLKKINKTIGSWFKKYHLAESEVKKHLATINELLLDNSESIKKIYHDFTKELETLCKEENRIETNIGDQIFQENIVKGDMDKTFQVNINYNQVSYYYPIASQCLFMKFFNDDGYTIDYITLSSFLKQISIYYEAVEKNNPFFFLKRGFLVNGFRIEYLDKWSHDGKEYYSAGIHVQDQNNQRPIIDVQIKNAGYNRTKEYFPTLRKEKNPENF